MEEDYAELKDEHHRVEEAYKELLQSASEVGSYLKSKLEEACCRERLILRE